MHRATHRATRRGIGTSALALTLGTLTGVAGLPGLVGLPGLPVEQRAAAVASHVLVGAGDIATCGGADDEATARLIDGVDGRVFTLGDNVYLDGSPTQFADCYDPTWGRHKARTRPVTGNHDYRTPGASGYFGYFGAAAGAAPKGWYSYDTGGWHVIVLNSNAGFINAEQLAWLESDLAANPEVCSVAMWHHPRYTSGAHALDATIPATQPLLNAVYAGGVDIVLNGHDHWYERFAPMDPTGAAESSGIRSFTVGTGGVTLMRPAPDVPIHPRSVVRDVTSHGVLRLTLATGRYSWRFLSTPGGTNRDAGSGTCQPGRRTLPVAADRFDRRATTSGWGGANIGGRWTVTDAANMRLDGVAATARFGSAGVNRAARLDDVATGGARIQARFGTTTPDAGGGGQRACIVARHAPGGSEYRVHARRRADGRVTLSITKTVSGQVVGVASEVVVPGVSATGMLHAIVEIRGTNPTLIRAKVFNSALPEPASWLRVATDSAAPLQVAGSVGWCGSVAANATAVPLRMTVDDFRADPRRRFVAYDDFARATAGWGSARLGGPWTVSAPADFSTNRSWGTARVTRPGGARGARLDRTSLRDLRVEGVVFHDKAARGGPQTSALVLRRVSTGNEYRVRIRFETDGSLRLGIVRFVGGAETLLRDTILRGVSASRPIHVVGEIDGTLLRARAFNAGSAEPGTWLIAARDSTASLQRSAPVGWIGQLAAATTNAPVVFTLDDFTASPL
jgi:3',5'-cyclic AMP phosphodiesterase CpdA